MAKMETAALLIVEDSDEDFALARWALQQAGFTGPLRRAASIAEALALLCPGCASAPAGAAQQAPAAFDVVLLDLNLPDGTGFDLLSDLRAEYAQMLPLPVVILTTSNNPRDVASLYRLGVSGYFVKPLDRKGFAAQIRSFADYWFSAVTLPPAAHPPAATRR